MENIAWVLLVSMVGGMAILLWFLYKPEKKCPQCERPLSKFDRSRRNPGILNNCNSCGCPGENSKEGDAVLLNNKNK